MSVAQVAIHGDGRRGPLSHVWLERVEHRDRPLTRIITFAALATYGMLRWTALERPAPGWRLTGLLALAVAVAIVGPRLVARARMLVVGPVPLAVLGLLVISGVPVRWMLELRVAVIATAIGHGLSALPDTLVPYLGADHDVRLVLALGAGLLLLSAALVIVFAPGKPGDLRRAAAALPLVGLAVVPSVAVHPRLPYLQGLVLFALLASFMWGDGVADDRAPGALAVAAVAGLAGVIVAPGLDRHRGWIDTKRLFSSAAPARVDTFDWTQRYGPLNWPRVRRIVLTVRAQRPDYWKTENLDVFNGVGWESGYGVTGSEPPGPSAAALRRFTQTVSVTIGEMSTARLVTAGFVSATPSHVDKGPMQSFSPGTWAVGTALGPGDSYTFASYSPAPSPAELEGDRVTYPSQPVADQLAVELPTNGLPPARRYLVRFPVFHARAPVQNVIGPPQTSGATLVERSVYAGAYAIARRLAQRSPTPYAFVSAVENYLSVANGFAYDEHPHPSTFPLETFLFTTRRGYCQQFAGAMGLLLRMGGIPARVATGFATGSYDSARSAYVVSDLDAHAWVEAWFPDYGWVRFDPTPAVAPARQDAQAVSGNASGRERTPNSQTQQGLAGTGTVGSVTHRHRPASGISDAVLGLAAAAGLALAALVAWWLAATPRTTDELVAELERALARSGRPLSPGATLRALEQRFGSSARAESYVRRLRLARFAADDSERPAGAQRRALRAQLAAGLGPVGKVRSWWALPPRPRLKRALH